MNSYMPARKRGSASNGAQLDLFKLTNHTANPPVEVPVGYSLNKRGRVRKASDGQLNYRLTRIRKARESRLKEESERQAYIQLAQDFIKKHGNPRQITTLTRQKSYLRQIEDAAKNEDATARTFSSVPDNEELVEFHKSNANMLRKFFSAVERIFKGGNGH